MQNKMFVRRLRETCVKDDMIIVSEFQPVCEGA